MNNLNVLHISTADNIGGAARAAYRLQKGLKAAGHASRMLVHWNVTNDPDVGPISPSLAFKFGDKIFRKFGDWTGRQYLYFPSTLALPHHPWFKEANVLQLHNLHGNFFAFPRLAALSKLKPTVWYLHDMWAFTGHAAYETECDCWRRAGRDCAAPLSEYPPLRWNTNALLWRRKKETYDQAHLTIVTPSTWLSKLAKESPLLGRFNVRTIPYGIDTTVFHPHAKEVARAELGLPSEAKILLFGSQMVDDPRKGGAFLKEALARLAPQDVDDWMIVTIGGGSARGLIPPAFKVKDFSKVDEEAKLARIYSAADVYALPTLADNLPNAILESLSCGTPVVSFQVGGVVDAVRHLETGYVAKYRDTADLASGLRMLMNNDPLRHKLSLQARETAVAEYDLKAITRRFLDLYAEVIREFDGQP